MQLVLSGKGWVFFLICTDMMTLPTEKFYSNSKLLLQQRLYNLPPPINQFYQVKF